MGTGFMRGWGLLVGVDGKVARGIGIGFCNGAGFAGWDSGRLSGLGLIPIW